jgi:hypothetical protein
MRKSFAFYFTIKSYQFLFLRQTGEIMSSTVVANSRVIRAHTNDYENLFRKYLITCWQLRKAAPFCLKSYFRLPMP